MARSDILTQSDTSVWETHPAVFAHLSELYGGFTFDAAASDEDHLCDRYFTEKQDALSRQWPTDERIFCNPPWGRGVPSKIADWLALGHYAAKQGAPVVCFHVPVKAEQSWWHEWAARGHILLVRGRLVFNLHGQPMRDGKGSICSATFASAFVIYQPGPDLGGNGHFSIGAIDFGAELRRS